jgi:glycosyltransferase involved in cell wall biosynthesis
VAHVITRLIIGGAQENTLLTVLGLQEDSAYLVDLISGIEKGPEGSLDVSQVKNLISVPSLIREIHPLYDFLCVLRLFFLFRKKKYHIVHTHASKAGILGRIAALWARVPILIHTVHGLPFHPYEHWFRNWLYIRLEKLCARFTRTIIVVSDAMREKALAQGIGSWEQYVTIYSGLRLDDFLKAPLWRDPMRQKLGFSAEHVVIGKVARFFSLKGHEYLLKIAQELLEQNPNIRFLFVGDGILLPGFQEAIEKRGLKKFFVFTGLIVPEEIPKYLSAMDILVHASLREGLARVLPQAMAARLSVVSFDIDGAKEVVDNASNGFLIPPENTEMMKERLLQMSRDPGFRKIAGEKGKQKVDPAFRHEIMIDKIKTLYSNFYA